MENTHNRLRIRMNKSFASFTEDDRKAFLTDLAELTGCQPSEFQDVKFIRGCVICELKLSAEIVLRLIDQYQRRNQLNKRDEQQTITLNNFIKKYNIAKISDDFEARIQFLRYKPQKNQKPKLLFIHGWRGSSSSFGNLPTYLSAELGCESLLYEYPTGITTPSPSISYVWQNLDNWLRNKKINQPIVAFAHSMGGIVTRRFLVEQYYSRTPLDRLFKLVTLIASPNDGASIANIAKNIPFFKKNQLEDISYSSEIMYDLSRHWQHWSEHNVPHNAIVRSVFGTEDMIVPSINAKGLDIEAVPILGAGHIDIVKPRSPNDEIVTTLVRFVHEAFSDRADPSSLLLA